MIQPKADFELIRVKDLEDIKYVPAIKTLRELAGLDLKAAKTIVDFAKAKPQGFTVANVDDLDIKRAISEMDDHGFKLVCLGRYEEYVQQLKELACVATMKGDYYFASRLTDFMDKF